MYATARRPEELGALEDAGCVALRLDVTDEPSMSAAVERVEADHGAVGVLVNNAGYSQSGALETLPLERVRRQFETNVFGLLRLTQLVLPGMRRRGRGTVVNVSSMGGRLTWPGAGAYHASKYAVEALSDTLRFEVAGFGVDVVVVEPGLVRTSFDDAVSEAMPQTGADDPYGSFNAEVERVTREAYEGAFGRLVGGEADDVARVIERALAADRPRTRYPVTPSARLFMWLRRLLPDRLWDAVSAASFPRPGRE